MVSLRNLAWCSILLILYVPLTSEVVVPGELLDIQNNINDVKQDLETEDKILRKIIKERLDEINLKVEWAIVDRTPAPNNVSRLMQTCNRVQDSLFTQKNTLDTFMQTSNSRFTTTSTRHDNKLRELETMVRSRNSAITSATQKIGVIERTLSTMRSQIARIMSRLNPTPPPSPPRRRRLRRIFRRIG